MLHQVHTATPSSPNICSLLLLGASYRGSSLWSLQRRFPHRPPPAAVLLLTRILCLLPLVRGSVLTRFFFKGRAAVGDDFLSKIDSLIKNIDTVLDPLVQQEDRIVDIRSVVGGFNVDPYYDGQGGPNHNSSPEDAASGSDGGELPPP